MKLKQKMISIEKNAVGRTFVQDTQKVCSKERSKKLKKVFKKLNAIRVSFKKICISKTKLIWLAWLDHSTKNVCSNNFIRTAVIRTNLAAPFSDLSRSLKKLNEVKRWKMKSWSTKKGMIWSRRKMLKQIDERRVILETIFFEGSKAFRPFLATLDHFNRSAFF